MAKRYWLSWYSTPAMGKFQLTAPWWKTDVRDGPKWDARDRDGAHQICAAIIADDSEQAKRTVAMAYEAPSLVVEWRFCQEMPADWTPYSDPGFLREPWMRWAEPEVPLVVRLRVGQRLTLRDLVKKLRENKPYEVSERDLEETELDAVFEVAPATEPSLPAPEKPWYADENIGTALEGVRREIDK